MKYRPLGKTGLQISALAIGCMRLPEHDPELAEKVVDAAIAAGVNYFETARRYVNGKCQNLTALGLKGRSRGLIVSGKEGIDENTSADSYREEIELQMNLLGVDYLEFFQVGWLTLEKLPLLTKKSGALEALNRARSEGIIGHIGFTGHDLPENDIRLIETGIFDSITTPYSMLERSYAPVIRRAGELGIGVVAMSPVAGGMLSNPLDKLRNIVPGHAETSTEAALKFVLANPDVSSACSGMNTVEMVEVNAAIVEGFHDLSQKDRARMDRTLDEVTSAIDKLCTACGYCLPCPEGVTTSWNMLLFNYAKVYGALDWSRVQYADMKKEERASACVRCGACEERCPHGLPVMHRLAEIASLLA